MKIHLSLCILLSFTGWSLAQSPHQEKKKEQLLRLMKTHISTEGKRPVPNFLLYIEDPGEEFVFYEGVGIVGRHEQTVEADYQFNIASITKTFVATVILQLVEEGVIKLTDKAADYLTDFPYLNMEQFMSYEGQSYGKTITIEQLLRHTSGIADIFTDAQTRFNLSVLTHKKRVYDLERIIKTYYKYKLHRKGLFKPGEGYHYSDMNYMLLGMVVEQVTASTLPEQIRQRILVPLKMDNTYFVYYEEQRGHGKRIDSYYNRINLTQKVNTSYEWGGGGLVSTTKELAIFIRALLDGELYRDKGTLDIMTDFSQTAAFGGNYGCGLSLYELNGTKYYGHGGFYGSLLFIHPKDRTILSVNVGQANVPFDATELVEKMLGLL